MGDEHIIEAEPELRRIIAEQAKEIKKLSAKIRRQERLLARYSGQNQPSTTISEGKNLRLLDKRAAAGQTE